MKKTLCTLASLIVAGSALAQADAAAQRAAMDKLAWLAGQWEGSATTQGREGEQRALSSDTVRRAAGCTALLVQGRHHRMQQDGTRGETVHDTAGLLSFDPASGKYRFTTQLQDGRGGVFDGTVQGDTFSWRLPLPDGHIRYDIARNERGQWSELGFFCRNGAECRPFFRMTLDRKGDAP